MSHANGLAKKTAEQLREELECVQLTRRIHQEKIASRFLEAYNSSSAGIRVPPRDETEPDEFNLSQLCTARDQGKCGYLTERELWQTIATARWLDRGNVFAQGPLTAITNKVIKTGYIYKVVARDNVEVDESILSAAQAEIDAFDLANSWCERERDIFRRSRRDGEFFLRFFPGDVLKVRAVEPNHVMNPIDGKMEDGWSFGIKTDPEDVEDVQSYWVAYNGQAKDGEEIDAAEIQHYKVNVDLNERRGLSDFFSIADIANELRILNRNMRITGAAISTISWIEQFNTSSQADVTAWADTQAELLTTNPRNGQAERHESYSPGQVIRTGAGKSFQPPPLATGNTPQLLGIAQLSRMALCARWNAHESVLGDASNGSYASLAVAESPFVTTAEVEQTWYGRRFVEVKRRALANAADKGRLPANILDIVDVEYEPPSVIVRDRLQQTQGNQILVQAGIMSPQTWAASEGMDWEAEQKQLGEAKAEGWQPPTAPAPAAGGGMFGGLPAGMTGEAVQRRLEELRQAYGPAVAERIAEAAKGLLQQGR